MTKKMTNYGISKQLTTSFGEALVEVEEALAKEGFGVLTRINVKEALKEKLGINFDEYVILGACNPSSAYQALQVSDNPQLVSLAEEVEQKLEKVVTSLPSE